jgi:hypothetical protein
MGAGWGRARARRSARRKSSSRGVPGHRAPAGHRAPGGNSPIYGGTYPIRSYMTHESHDRSSEVSFFHYQVAGCGCGVWGWGAQAAGAQLTHQPACCPAPGMLQLILAIPPSDQFLAEPRSEASTQDAPQYAHESAIPITSHLVVGSPLTSPRWARVEARRLPAVQQEAWHQYAVHLVLWNLGRPPSSSRLTASLHR